MATAEVSKKSCWSVQERRREWNAADARSRLSKRRSLLAIRIFLDCAWHSQTGMQNYASCKTRRFSMRIRSRLERLEDKLQPLPAGDTLRWTIRAIGEK